LDDAIEEGIYVELSDTVDPNEKYKLILNPIELFVEYEVVNRTLYLTQVPLDYKVTTSDGKKYTQGSQYSNYQISGKIRIERHVVSITSISQEKIYIFPYISFDTTNYDLSQYYDITNGTIEIPEKEFTVGFFSDKKKTSVSNLQDAKWIIINRHGINHFRYPKYYGGNDRRDVMYTYSKIMNMIDANRFEREELGYGIISFYPPNNTGKFNVRDFKVFLSKSSSDKDNRLEREIKTSTNLSEQGYKILSFEKNT
jgi:hypothetical protein